MQAVFIRQVAGKRRFCSCFGLFEILSFGRYIVGVPSKCSTCGRCLKPSNYRKLAETILQHPFMRHVILSSLPPACSASTAANVCASRGGIWPLRRTHRSHRAISIRDENQTEQLCKTSRACRLPLQRKTFDTWYPTCGSSGTEEQQTNELETYSAKTL